MLTESGCRYLGLTAPAAAARQFELWASEQGFSAGEPEDGDDEL